jgi:glycosyltransferase involved in cell wall biosynthesis
MVYHHFLVSRELGGAGLIAMHLARELTRRGKDSQLWVPSKGQASHAADREALRWRRSGVGALTQNNVAIGLGCLRIALGLQRGGGIAHVHTPSLYRLIRPALRVRGLRTAVHVHLEPQVDEVRWAFRDPPDLIIPCASFMSRVIREALGEQGAAVRIEAVPNAVDIDRFYPHDKAAAKQRLGAPADRPLVLMIANLAPHKGQETAIRAVAELKARGTAVECWLAGVERGGGQAYQLHLRTLAGECGVADRVRLLGFRGDAPDLLRAADFLVLPSTSEGLPLSILEAQASKVPSLAAPTAGVPEVIADGETGFLIAAADAAGYARRIEGLLADRGVYQRVAEQAYNRVRREHNWGTYCRRIEDLYESLLDTAPPYANRARDREMRDGLAAKTPALPR